MIIAIIEDNLDYSYLIKETLKEYNWEIDFYHDSPEFGMADLRKYDVIVSDYQLPTLNGRDLLKSIQTKTNAELFLMSAMPISFLEEDIDNSNINGLIDKTDIQNLVDQLKYCDAKIRINKICETEQEKLNEILSNGFTLEIKDDIMFIKMQTVLSEPSKKRILAKILLTGIKRAILSFPEKSSINSAYLGMITYFYKVFNTQKGFIAFWNSTQSRSVEYQIKTCKLDLICPIFNELDQAVSFLKSK